MEHAFYENRNGHLAVSVTRDLNFPTHLHWTLEIVYVRSGVLNVLVQGREVTLHRGDTVLFFPYVIHGYRAGKGDSVICICSPLEFLEVQSVVQYWPQKTVFKAKEMEDVYHQEMDEMARLEDESEMKFRESLLRLVLMRLLRHTRLVRRERTPDEEWMKRANEYILENFTQPITLEELARHVGVNKYTFSKTFSRIMGASLPTYINSFRVEYAKEMLRATRKSITQVALESGFENVRTFNRSFGHVMGCSPRDYRMASDKESAENAP